MTFNSHLKSKVWDQKIIIKWLDASYKKVQMISKGFNLSVGKNCYLFIKLYPNRHNVLLINFTGIIVY